MRERERQSEGSARSGRAWRHGLAVVLLLLLADWRACRAMCLQEEPTADDYAIEEKKRSLAAKHGFQIPGQDKSVMDTVVESKKRQYEECIQRGEKVLRQLGQERYEETPVSTGTFKRDKITGKMWFDGPDGEREIVIRY